MALKLVKLSRANQKKLEPGKTIFEHGAYLTRLFDGDSSIGVNVMVDKVRHHHILGKESEGVTITDALKFIEQIRTEARQNRLNLPKGRKLPISFKEAAEQYLIKLEQEGGKDLITKRQKLADYLVPFFGSMQLSEIGNSDIECYKKKRLEEFSLHGGDKIHKNGQHGASVKPVTPGTVNRELAILSHFFTKVVEWKWIDAKPAQVKLLKLENCRITYLTTEQMDGLLEASKNDHSEYIYLFIMIGLETSMRKMEILSISISNIDLHRRVIFVPQAKAGSREQPITFHLAEFLDQHLKQVPVEQVWLFPSPKSETGHMVSIEKAFNRVVAAAGLDPKKVLRHTLRHTAITHLVQAGVDLPTVQRISGHKTLQMVVRYSHQNGEHIQEAMEKLENRYRVKDEKAG